MLASTIAIFSVAVLTEIFSSKSSLGFETYSTAIVSILCAQKFQSSFLVLLLCHPDPHNLRSSEGEFRGIVGVGQHGSLQAGGPHAASVLGHRRVGDEQFEGRLINITALPICRP